MGASAPFSFVMDQNLLYVLQKFHGWVMEDHLNHIFQKKLDDVTGPWFGIFIFQQIGNAVRGWILFYDMKGKRVIRLPDPVCERLGKDGPGSGYPDKVGQHGKGSDGYLSFIGSRKHAVVPEIIIYAIGGIDLILWGQI